MQAFSAEDMCRLMAAVVVVVMGLCVDVCGNGSVLLSERTKDKSFLRRCFRLYRNHGQGRHRSTQYVILVR